MLDATLAVFLGVFFRLRLKVHLLQPVCGLQVWLVLGVVTNNAAIITSRKAKQSGKAFVPHEVMHPTAGSPRCSPTAQPPEHGKRPSSRVRHRSSASRCSKTAWSPT